MMIYMYCIVGRQLPALTLTSYILLQTDCVLIRWPTEPVLCVTCLCIQLLSHPSTHRHSWPPPPSRTAQLVFVVSCHDDAVVIMSMITCKVLCCVYVVCVSLTESTWWYATEAIRAYTVMQYENNDACWLKVVGGHTHHHHHHWWSELTAACIKHFGAIHHHHHSTTNWSCLLLYLVAFTDAVSVCVYVCVSGYHQYCCNRMLTPSPSYRNINHTQLLVFHYLCLIEYVVTAHTLYTLHASFE